MNLKLKMMAAALVALLAGNALAAVVITETWETGGNAEGWDVQTQVGTATRNPDPPAQGALSGHNALLFGTGADVPGVDQDLISEVSGDVVSVFNVLGDPLFSTSSSITFDFYANADSGGNGAGVVTPLSLFLYFETPTVVWYYDMLADEGVPGSAGWYSYDATVTAAGSPDAGWVNDDGHGALDFMPDMGDATQVGIWITYQAWDDQSYAIDNFALYNDTPLGPNVPEPGFWVLLAMALVSVVIPFRHRLPALLPVFATR